MSKRLETFGFILLLVLIGAFSMVDQAKNWLRDIEDDYPVLSLGVSFLIGFCIGFTIGLSV